MYDAPMPLPTALTSVVASAIVTWQGIFTPLDKGGYGAAGLMFLVFVCYFAVRYWRERRAGRKPEARPYIGVGLILLCVAAFMFYNFATLP